MGLGFTTMGILAGQFTFLMAILLFNTFFDKWPFVRKQITPPSGK
jgi:AAT family amino acid transporter